MRSSRPALFAIAVAASASSVGCDFVRELRMKRAAAELCTIPERRELGAPYLRGRVAVVDLDTHRWEPLVGNYLPEELSPRSADEISTCMMLSWESRAVGLYDVTKLGPNGARTPAGTEAAVQQMCKITVVDLTIPAVVGEAFVKGRAPADSIRSDGTGDRPAGTAAKPIEEIEAYYKALPRKP